MCGFYGGVLKVGIEESPEAAYIHVSVLPWIKGSWSQKEVLRDVPPATVLVGVVRAGRDIKKTIFSGSSWAGVGGTALSREMCRALGERSIGVLTLAM